MKIESTLLLWVTLLVNSICLIAGAVQIDHSESAKDITITMPSIAWSTSNFQQNTKQLQKDFKQSIFVETNPNLGSFLTKSELPLPPNLVGLNSIALNYDSQYTENKGMGIGWRWGLPSIIHHSSFSQNGAFSYSGSWGHFELIRTNEAASVPSGLIKSLSGWSGDIETFRPAVDENGALFVKLGSAGWLGLSLSGERWLFSSSGLPIRCFNAKKQYLELVWTEGVLVKVLDPLAKWSIQFKYSDDRQVFPNYLDDKWLNLPKCLTSMTTSTESNELRIVDFSCSDEYLVKVQVRGGVRSFFEAEYRNYLPKLLGRSANGLVKDDKKILVDRNGVQSETIIPEDGMVYADLNGDQKTDRIVLHSKELNDFIEQWLKQNSESIKREIRENNGENWNETKLNEFVRRYVIKHLATQDIHVHVEMAIAETPEGRTEFKRDDSIDLEAQVRKSGGRFIQLGECGEKICFEPRASFRFVDLNKDGLRDIILTPVTSRIDEQKHMFSNWLYNLVTLKPTGAVDFQSLTTGTPKIFILERDEAKIQNRWDELKSTSTPLAQVNSLLGYHKLTPLTNIEPLSINQETPFVDLGGGRIGCFGGTSFYIISGFDPVNRSLRVTQQTFVARQLIDNHLVSPDGGDLLNSADAATMVRFGPRHQWQVVSARDIEQRLGSSTFKIVQDIETIEVQPGSPTQMMSKVKSSYGGSYNISYKLHSGVWVVDHLKKDTLGAINTSESYDYQTLGVDPFRGTWIGFSKVNITHRANSELIIPKIVEKKYYKDVAPGVILYGSRARLNGRLGQEQLRSVDGRLIEVKTFHAPLVLLTKDSRILLMPQTFDHRKYLKDGKTYRQRDLRAFRVIDWIRDGANEELFPLSVIHERIGSGLRSEVSDSLVDGHETIKVTNSFYPQEYRTVPVRQEKTPKNDVKASPIKSYFYNPETVELIKSCEENRCANYSFDSVGRLNAIQHSNGDWIKAGYSGNSPIPNYVEDADDAKQVISSAFNGRPLRVKDSKGTSISYIYTSDDITREVTRLANDKSTTLFSVKEMTPENISKRMLTIKTYDRDEVWYFDGFGNIIERLILKNQKWFSLGREEYFEYQLIRKWGASAWATPQELFFKTSIDERGLALNEWTRSDGTSIFGSDGGCTVKVLNGERETEQCQTSFGNLTSQRIGNEEVLLDTLENRTVMGISTYGISYERNNFQDIIGVSAALAPTNGWVAKRRSFDPEGLKMQTYDQFDIQRDPKGRVLKTTSINSQQSQIEEENVYSRGLLRERTLSVGKKPFRKTDLTYDSLGEIIASHEIIFGENLDKAYKRDSYGRIREEKVVTKQGIFKTEAKYEQGEILQLLPFVNSIQRDPKGNITTIVYNNGATVEREFVPFTNRMTSVSVRMNSTILYRETYTYNNVGQIISRKIEDTVSETLKVQNEETFEYNKQNYQLSTDVEPMKLERNIAGNIISIKDKRGLFYTGDSLTSAGQSVNYYDYKSQLQMSCRYRLGQETKPGTNCFVKLSNDEFMLNGYYGREVMIDGLAIGFWLNGVFYPTISDHLGSIKALLTPNGQALVLTREFSAWGAKKTHFVIDEKSFHDLDKFLVWTYAGLISNPIYEMTRKEDDFELYWSESRIYSPKAREWLSVDSKLLWQPEELSDKPGNWHPMRYASNDPMNRVDPVGTIAGDVWLYEKDSSRQSDIAEAASYLADGFRSLGSYTHASLEINNNRQFTANLSLGNGGMLNNDSILFNESGNSPRLIDVYRHKDYLKFNAESATTFAEYRSVLPGRFGLNGWCSSATLDGLHAGGLKSDSYFLTTPNGLSRDSNLQKVGRYNTAAQRSEGIQK